jgi:sodium-coupled monocarboxylate transporter 8/12
VNFLSFFYEILTKFFKFYFLGASGLFVAGIFSASLSTVSSCLNSLAAVSLEDYFKPLYKYIADRPLKLSDSNSAIPSKIIAAIYGLICIGVAYIAQSFVGILQISLTIFGTVGGPILALFTLGMATITANERGSVFGLALGVALSMWIGFADKAPPVKLHKSVEDCSQFGLFNLTSSIPVNVPDNNE